MRLQKILTTIGNVSDLVEDLVERLDGVDSQVRAGLRKLRRRVKAIEADLTDSNEWFESADERFANHDGRLLKVTESLAYVDASFNRLASLEAVVYAALEHAADEESPPDLS